MSLFGLAFDLITENITSPSVLNKTPLSLITGNFSSKGSSKRVSPAVGSVVWCELAGNFEHSGIYVGGNRIVHLDGDGTIISTSPAEFKRRLFGLNPAEVVYVSAQNNRSVGAKRIAKRAKQMIGKRRDYNLIFDNCHQFTAGCISGDFENANNFFWLLEMIVDDEFGSVNWNVMRE